MNYKAVFLFPIEYLLIVGYVIIVIWTCVERFILLYMKSDACCLVGIAFGFMFRL